MTHPPHHFTARIRFPEWMIPCPKCGRHYTVRGWYRRNTCAQLARR